MFVMISRYVPPDETKRTIVHAYGPYATREAANRDMRKDKKEYPDVEFHVCMILNPEDEDL